MRRRTIAARHSGFALVVGLILLVAMTLLGISALRGTILQERMAGNLRDRDLAFQAAEAALREGEALLEQAALPAFGAGAPGLVLPQRPPGSSSAFWNDFDWSDARPATGLAGVLAPPRYVVEPLPPVARSGDSVAFAPLPQVQLYRITARGVGGTHDAVVILQVTYRR